MQCLYVVPKTTRDVGESLSTLHAEQKRENRLCFVTILSNLQFLACQGLALRGDGDEKNSNFHQLLALRLRESSLLKAWMEKRTDKYTSPDIQNSVIGIMANRILRNLVSTIHSSPFCSIMADESVDRSNKEQLVTCLRWVDDNFNAHEGFLGLYEVPNTEAVTIFKAIEDIFK